MKSNNPLRILSFYFNSAYAKYVWDGGYIYTHDKDYNNCLKHKFKVNFLYGKRNWLNTYCKLHTM